MVELLTDDLLDESISPEFLASLEREVPSFAGLGEPKAKRQKLGFTEACSLLSLEEKVTICSALKNVVQGEPPHPQLWRKLGSTDTTHHLEFILQVSLGGRLHRQALHTAIVSSA